MKISWFVIGACLLFLAFVFGGTKSDRVIRRGICCYLIGRDNSCRLLRKKRYEIEMKFSEFKAGKLYDYIYSRDIDPERYLMLFPVGRFMREVFEYVCNWNKDSCALIDDTSSVTIIIDFFYHVRLRSVFYHYYIMKYRDFYEGCERFQLTRKGIEVWGSWVITKHYGKGPPRHYSLFDKGWYKRFWREVIE